MKTVDYSAKRGSNCKKRVIRTKIEGLVRLGMCYVLSKYLPLYIVTEYPKSGGSWLGEMLAVALNVPFPRNRFPILKSSIIHGHYLRSWNMKNTIVVWRDCRDVIVSQYFHFLHYNDRGNQNLVNQTRKRVPFSDYDKVWDNLPQFICFVFEVKRHPRFTWTEFARQWAFRKDVIHVKYENLLIDTTRELRRLVQKLTGRALPEDAARRIAVDFSFTKMSGRQPGEEDRGSFMRKGVSGDWKRCFSKEARRLMDQYAGVELINLGYESDAKWVHDC